MKPIKNDSEANPVESEQFVPALQFPPVAQNYDTEFPAGVASLNVKWLSLDWSVLRNINEKRMNDDSVKTR